MNTLFLNDRQVSARYGVSRSTVWRWISDGVFPKPIKLTGGCSRWKLETLEKWESEKLSKREEI